MVEVRRTTLLRSTGKEYWYDVVIWIDYADYLLKKGRKIPRRKSIHMSDKRPAAMVGDLEATDEAALAEFGIDEGDGAVVEGLTLTSPPSWLR